MCARGSGLAAFLIARTRYGIWSEKVLTHFYFFSCTIIIYGVVYNTTEHVHVVCVPNEVYADGLSMHTRKHRDVRTWVVLYG